MVRRLSQVNSQEIAAQLWDQNAQAIFSNNNIEGKQLIKSQNKLAESIRDEQIQTYLKKITSEISKSISDTIISKQADNVGGLYNHKKEIHLNQNVFHFSKRSKNQSIQSNIEETTSRIKHIYNHEHQHAEHNDHKPLKIPHDGLLLGGILLSSTEVIEGANMSVTGTHINGKQIVSNDYLAIHHKFQSALSRSKYTLNEFVDSLKNRDVVKHDDRYL